MYGNTTDFALFVQQPSLDTPTATLLLAKASELFDKRAESHWGGTLSTTYSKPGTGACELVMPLAPLVSVSAVRVAGVTITDFAVIEQSLFRRIGFGVPWRYPPDLVEVDYTYGYPATAPDDVIAVVYETAAAALGSPIPGTLSEQIDDYARKMSASAGGMHLTSSAMDLADWYRGPKVM